MDEAPGPLAPYRILDLTNECGQLGARMLADLGADVIKVEPPGGSSARRIGPFYHDDPRPDRSLAWLYHNANKRGVTLNVQTEAGRSLLRRLVEKADALFESFAPGELDELGIGYGALSAINPGLVMASITPFGAEGPYAHYKTSDLVAWAMGGKLWLDGDADRPPTRISVPEAYEHAGAHAAMGVVTALFARAATGRGQRVDVSVQQAVCWALLSAPQTWDLAHRNMSRGGSVRTYPPGAPKDSIRHRLNWPCKDGFVHFPISGGSQKGSAAATRHMIEWMEREGVAGDLIDIEWTQFDVRSESQGAIDHIEEAVGRFIAGKTKEELTEASVAHGIRLAPLNDTSDVFAYRQLRERNYWQEVDHNELGATITFPGATVKMSETPWRLRRRAPLLGEHNAEVYGELGLTAEELRALRETGAI